MGKFGVFGIFIVVCVGHLLALQSTIAKQNSISKPKAKVHHITLSSVVIKKETPVPTPPKPEPIILPPEPEPIVKKPKPKPKPKRRVKKPVITPPPVVEKTLKEVTPEPIVEQVIAKVEKIDTSSIRDKYTSEIRVQIRKNLIYPRLAKRLRLQDIVKVSFRVQKNGTINNIKILNKPKKVLQNGAIKTLKSLTLKAIPSELDAEFMDIVIPIEFKLIQG